MVKVSRTADANKAKELSVQAGEYVEVKLHQILWKNYISNIFF